MADILKLFLEASVMAAIMTAVVLLIRRFMAKRLRPSVMLILWGMVLLRLCLPFTIDSPLSLITIPQQTTSVNAINDTTPSSLTTSGSSNASDTSTMNTYTQAENESMRQAAAETDKTHSALSALQRVSVSLWDILSAVWLAGAILTLLLFAGRARRFTKDLKLCRPVTDAGVLDILRRHKEASGVKANIAVLECPFAYSPMVIGCFRPRIIIPPQFLRMNREALGAILLHEVCHIRRRDILKNYIWLTAKALHWFNPLVWLAYKRYEDDVEICRDDDAARMLESDGGIVYSMSLLEAARLAGSAASASPPAAALFENKCSLKTRIQRLLRPQRNAAFYPAAALLLALVMAVSCFTTACQPTPATPPVTGKNVDLVKMVIDANKTELESDKKNIEEQISKLGGRLKMTFEPSERVKINVDADIISRGFTKLPLVRVRPKNFSKEQFEAFAKYLTNGQPLYYQEHGDNLSIFSKEELEIILPRIKKQLEGITLPEASKEEWNFNVKQLEMEYENAKAKADEKPYDGKLSETFDNTGYSTITYLKCYMGKDMAACLDMWQSFNNASSQMVFNNYDYACGYNTFEPYEGKDAERINITYEQAKAKAEEFVRAMDGEDTNMEVYESSIGYENDMITNYTKETSPQCYQFNFARSYNGVDAKPVNFVLGMTAQSENGETAEIDYNKVVWPESLRFIIDSEGICEASWQNQTEYIETVTEDTPLLDFDTIKGIFENYCKYRFSWAPPYDDMPKDMGVTFNVKRVELNLIAIPEKDNLENYITVPVWDFIADQEYEEVYIDQEGYPVEGQKDISIITINAINGTVINREQGY